MYLTRKVGTFQCRTFGDLTRLPSKAKAQMASGHGRHLGIVVEIHCIPRIQQGIFYKMLPKLSNGKCVSNMIEKPNLFSTFSTVDAMKLIIFMHSFLCNHTKC